MADLNAILKNKMGLSVERRQRKAKFWLLFPDLTGRI